jgi:hypothetical protein
MKKIGIFLVLFCLLTSVVTADGELPPLSFFVDEGSPNCSILVGKEAAALDVISATELAVFISSKAYETTEIEIQPEQYRSEHAGIEPGTMVIDTPETLPTLWYQDVHPWGDMDQQFDPWETHEEIRVQPVDFPELTSGTLQPDGLLEFLGIEQNKGTPGIMYVADNVRIPPRIYVTSSTPYGDTRVVDLDYFSTLFYPLPDPEFRIPQFILLGEMYGTVDAGYFIDYIIETGEYDWDHIPSAYVLTGVPQYHWGQKIFVGEPVYYGVHEIELIDVDVDHNKCYLAISEPNLGDEELFRDFMVLDPDHGFSPGLQESGVTGCWNCIKVGRSQYDCAVISETVMYVDENGLTHFEYGYPVFVLDGIMAFIGAEERRGIQCNIYTLTEYMVLRDRYCCVPFVTEPNNYSMMIHFSTTAFPSTIFDVNAYHEVVPSEFQDYDPADFLGYYPYNLNSTDFMFEVVVGLCDTIHFPECKGSFITDGPRNFFWGTYEVQLSNPYFTIEILDGETSDGFDFAVIQERQRDALVVKEPMEITGSELVFLDVEFMSSWFSWTEGEIPKNLVLVGGPEANAIVKILCDTKLSQILWEISLGTWEYLPNPYSGCGILIVAGRDREATREAAQELIKRLASG